MLDKVKIENGKVFLQLTPIYVDSRSLNDMGFVWTDEIKSVNASIMVKLMRKEVRTHGVGFEINMDVGRNKR